MPAVERDKFEELKNALRDLAEKYSWEDIDEALEEITEEDNDDG